MRLQKYIAYCGVASRRKAEIMIQEGRVIVNGDIVDAMGFDVDEENDQVQVDGKLVQIDQQHIYVILNKPTGYISTAKDQFGRKSVTDLVEIDGKRIYPVGRLDYDTSGLLLLTDDGEFTYKMTHPKHQIYKTYQATLDKKINEKDVTALENGVDIGGFVTSKAYARMIDRDAKKVEIKIYEGKNRQVRKMFEALGYEVIALERGAIGKLKIGNLKPGQWRYLKEDEFKDLDK